MPRFGRHYWCSLRDRDALATRGQPRRALRPNRANAREPLLDHSPEPAWPRVFDRADLIGKTEFAEQRNRFNVLRPEAPVREPHIKVQHRWRRGKELHGSQVVRNRLPHEFLIELIAQGDYVFKLGG